MLENSLNWFRSNWNKLRNILFSALRSNYFYILSTLALGGFFGLAYWSWITASPQNTLRRNISMGAMTSIIGTIIVAFVIDQIWRRHREIARAPARRTALKQLEKEIQRVNRLIGKMAKASAPSPWDEAPQDLSELFSSEVSEQICWRLNVQKEAPIAQNNVSWRKYLKIELKDIRSKLNNALMKYSQYLPEQTLVDMEEIRTSLFLTWSTQLVTIEQIDRQNSYDRFPAYGPGLEDSLADNFEEFYKIIQRLNDKLEENGIGAMELSQDLTSRDEAPQVGENRIDIPKKVINNDQEENP